MTVNFVGVILQKLKRDHKGGTLEFSAELTAPIGKAMKWGDLPDGCTGGKMEGAITAASIEMSPKQKDLFKSAELSADVTEVTGFEIVRLELEGKKGKGFRYELRFKAKFVAEEIAALAEAWMVAVGEGKGTLRVTGTVAEKAEEVEDDKVLEMKG